jgi:hypothetical protein
MAASDNSILLATILEKMRVVDVMQRVRKQRIELWRWE